MARKRLYSLLLSCLAPCLLLATSVAWPASRADTYLAAPQALAAGVDPATRCKDLVPFDSANFPAQPTSKNRWAPLIPGTKIVLEGFANRGGGRLEHRLEINVSNVTKVISGVRTLVVLEQDFNKNELVEDEIAFHAHDNDGNYWNLGEYPEELDKGKFTGAPSTWITGQRNAVGGILVPGAPKVGPPSFRQGYAPTITFYDCGQTAQTGQHLCVHTTCYDDVLVVDEWAPLESQDGVQQKYYAPGIGNVQVGAIGDPEGETLKIERVEQMNPQELAQVCTHVLALDAHAYEIKRSLYGTTQPAQGQCSPAPSPTTPTTPDASPSTSTTPDASPSTSTTPTTPDASPSTSTTPDASPTTPDASPTTPTASPTMPISSPTPGALQDCIGNPCEYLPFIPINPS